MTKSSADRPPLPDLSESERKKPLCYDPVRKKFIFYQEIVDGREDIVPLEKLSEEDATRLVIERNLKGPGYTMQIMSGNSYTRNDIVREIRDGTAVGRMAVFAELSYLKELLQQIQVALKN